MRVIEQLIRHFWASGELSCAEARRLLASGFVSPESLPDLEERAAGRSAGGKDPLERWAEEPPAPRAVGKRRRGRRRRRPTGHNLTPLCAQLARHFAVRRPHAALVELGGCAGCPKTH
jgi:hypothetical protein